MRPGAARLVIGRAGLLGSPQKRFFHDPQRDSARAAVAAKRDLQSTRQASRRRTTGSVIPQAYSSKAAGPPFAELCRVV
jgi:hypothetical protein